MKRLLALSLLLPAVAQAVIVEYTLVENSVGSVVGTVRTTEYPLGDASPGGSQPPAEFSYRSDTFGSIGMEWDVSSTGYDSDHDATVTVEYKKSSSGTWLNAASLMRGDFAPFYNQNSYDAYDHFAGSITFLTAGTEYDVRLTYDDPDDTDAEDGNVYTFSTTTRAYPVKPAGGCDHYVVAGSGSGNAGTSGDPFEGLDEADDNAVAGDIMCLRDTNGKFTGTADLTTAGTAGNYIVYQPDSGHSPVIEKIDLEIQGNAYLWFDNLEFENGSAGQTAIDQPFNNPDFNVAHVVVTGNSFTGYNEAVRMHRSAAVTGGCCWTVMDNTIVGDKAAGQGSTGPTDGDGYGVKASPAGGHVVAYNDISRVADGIGTFPNSDIYGNNVTDVTDDTTTNDGNTHNGRVWGNRLSDTAGYLISAQPQAGSPTYYMYNVMVTGPAGNVCKCRVVDRIVYIGNTMHGSFGKGQSITRWFHHNNMHIKDSAPVLGGANQTDADDRATIASPTWETDVDYNGYWWGGPASNAFRWFDPEVSYNGVSSWRTAIGGGVWEANGVELDDPDAGDLFVDYTPSETWDALIKSTSNAADAGEVIDNLADWQADGFPDLGAQEEGGTAHQFGPRSGELSTALGSRTDNWVKY